MKATTGMRVGLLCLGLVACEQVGDDEQASATAPPEPAAAVANLEGLTATQIYAKYTPVTTCCACSTGGTGRT
jgi:hypothetical protein